MVVDLKFSRFEDQPWGFRLTGGKDFPLPLTVVKVSNTDTPRFTLFCVLFFYKVFGFPCSCYVVLFNQLDHSEYKHDSQFNDTLVNLNTKVNSITTINVNLNCVMQFCV